MRWLAATLLLAARLAVSAVPPTCEDCVKAQYWQIDPDFWTVANPDLNSFPERQLGTPLPGEDLGVAFSGGGTRSAAATIGQLRGLLHNGWFGRVKYLTAVSGGSWAAVPFTYYPGEDLVPVVGSYTELKALTLPDVVTTPDGKLARQVVNSGLAASGVAEVPQLLPDKIGATDVEQLRLMLVTIRDGLRKLRKRDLPDPSRRNKTYAHMLGQIFLDPLVKDANRRPYTWTRDEAIRVTEVSQQPQSSFLQVPAHRPFLIAGGTLVWMRPGFVYPRLIPVEYTPLYTGVRQRFGNLGGTYVMSWAYDREQFSVAGDRLVVGRSDVRMFTLADVIGSSGAAPQLALLLADRAPAKLREPLRQAAEAFPAFMPMAVRDGQAVVAPGELAHGDGGFTDNLGIMPLLARQVGHVIVFVNANKPHTSNEQLQSYFFPLALRTNSGDKSMNAVFPASKYRDLLEGLDAATRTGGAAVFCDTVDVAKNELYNIAAYKGLKICWVYNQKAAFWVRDRLPATIQKWLTSPDAKPRGRQAKWLRNFPYYETFGENKPRVIKLNALQVNLLADLACWSITNPESVRAIVKAFGEAVVPTPPAPTTERSQ